VEQRPIEAGRLLAASAERAHDTTAVTRLLLRQLSGDTAGLALAIAALPADNEWALMQLASWEGTELDRPDLARACLLALADPGHTPVTRAFGHEGLAWIEMSAGRWRAAIGELRAAAAFEPVSAATDAAVLWAAPFLPRTLADTGRPQARIHLARAPLSPVTRSSLFWQDYDRGREPVLRWYLDGLLAVQSGRTMRLVPPPGNRPLDLRDSLSDLTHPLQNSLQAWARAMSGDTAMVTTSFASALEQSEAIHETISVFWSRPWDRYQQAMALESARPELAADLFATLGTVSLATLPYRAPALLKRAALLERLGRRADAIAAYRTGLALWSGADPEFQPWLDQARTRLAALESQRP
jgi:hypothetical protein